MKRLFALIYLCLLIQLALLLWWARKTTPTPSPPPAPSPATSPEEVAREPPFLGEVLLEDYASPHGSVQEDLRYLQRVLMSVRTLVKTQDPGRMAVNEDVVEVLLGKNPNKTVFLPSSHPAINESGQLIDRWGTPLFFHLEAADWLDVRSAGPDGKLFTVDDCHLHADGVFMKSDRLASAPHF